MNAVLRRPEIKSIIITVLNNKWNADYVIRYVTVEVSKLVQRDVSFFKMHEDEKIKQLSSLNYETSYPYVVCKTLHELIRDILDCLGISSRVVKATNTKVPLYALIVDGEYGRYFIDALNDLQKVQYHIQPVTYGNIIHSNNSILNENQGFISLSLDYIREMDIQLGIIENEYFSDYIERIKLTYVDRNLAMKRFGAIDSLDLLTKKIKHISHQFLNLYQVDGPLERVGIHVFFRNRLFNKTERRQFRVILSEDNKHVIISNEFGSYTIVYEEIKENNEYSLVQTKFLKRQ